MHCYIVQLHIMLSIVLKSLLLKGLQIVFHCTIALAADNQKLGGSVIYAKGNSLCFMFNFNWEGS